MDRNRKAGKAQTAAGARPLTHERGGSNRADAAARAARVADDMDAAEFARQLSARSQAAKGLEKDLLHEVPLLYGSAGRLEARGDPGIVLADIHRDEIVRRNGGGMPPYSGTNTSESLPYERAMMVLAILLFIVFSSGILG